MQEQRQQGWRVAPVHVFSPRCFYYSSPGGTRANVWTGRVNVGGRSGLCIKGKDAGVSDRNSVEDRIRIVKSETFCIVFLPNLRSRCQVLVPSITHEGGFTFFPSAMSYNIFEKLSHRIKKGKRRIEKEARGKISK